MAARAKYTARWLEGGEAKEKTFDKMASAMNRARLQSKVEGCTNACVVKQVGPIESDVCAYVDGKAVKSNGDKSSDQIIADFQQREGSLRMKLLQILVKNFGEPVKARLIEEKMYGESVKSSQSAVMMVLAGLKKAITDHKLAYTIVLEKIDGERTIGLFKGKQGRSK